ncbi:MAG: 2,3,4,5-tetrahydropyridine-2,6-dicarboxylate N-succinyltransferase [Porticoccaceae bacterium]|jgi:2,3,4,5-tetrahydropyridine-2-carboxylate N-succinyltransferase|nr:2,3,4,5-tetrahydropyridine-2,6-dicarboxylate N-succinyltransferase [Porticoccaceae bacterium]
MAELFGLGLGVGTGNGGGDLLEVFYPQPLLHPRSALAEAFATTFDYRGGNREIHPDSAQLSRLADALAAADATALADQALALRDSSRIPVLALLDSDTAPASVAEAYLKLHWLSHRLARPHELNLTGIFGCLPNVAWTSEGAIDLAELTQRQWRARLASRQLSVYSVDKFPRLTDYVAPSGVRIADTARVRLGAYLGEGTTVMHEGFINFNAGTEGPNMVEGRISAGVFVGAGSDLGGSSSTMGTLSGGGNLVISVGRECLIGANAGIGIPLGDRCTVEAGLYVTAGTKVTLLDDRRQRAGTAKARELAGRSDLLFRRNSETGAVECLTNRTAVALNEALHSHN